MSQEASVDLVLSGNIALDNQITLRTLGKVAQALQSAINRSYLDLKMGGVLKRARLIKSDYPITEFYAGTPQAGSFRIGFNSKSDWSIRIVDRLNMALMPIYDNIRENAVFESVSLKDRSLILQEQIRKGIGIPIKYKDIDEETKKDYLLRYGDRSILKEFDRLLHVVRPQHAGDSQLSVSLKGSSTSSFPFDRAKSQSFRQAITHQDLGRVIEYNGRITMLDTDNKNANFENYDTGKKCTLRFNSLESTLLLSDKILKDISILASPVLEYAGFDYIAGDLYFIELLK